MDMRRTVALVLLSLVLCISLASCASGTVVHAATQTLAGSTSPTAPATPTVAPAKAPAMPATTAAEPLRFVNPKKYAVQYTVTLTNTGSAAPAKAQVYLPLPSEWDAQKDLKITSITPDPKSQAAEPVSGNKILYWQLAKTPKQGTPAELTLNFEVTAYETNTSIDAAAVKPYDTTSADYKRYTKAEKYIESGDAGIAALAKKLAGSEANPYLQARKFYDYIIDHTTYKLLGQGLNGAKFLLDNGFGECGDYSALFIALCRAQGIPARPVVGYWAISGNDQTHVWAEFYLQDIGWIPVDATIGQQSASKRAYYFGNMDNQRMILSKGYNTPLVPAAPGGYVSPILQVPLWWYQGGGTLAMDRDWKVTGK